MVRRLGMVRGALLAAALASWAVTPSALAQQAQPSANEVAMAREQSRLGTEAARGGRWREALDAYQRAYQLNPRPQTLLNVGSAQMSLGLLVQGTETYRRFLQEAPADGPLGQYRATAEQALQDIAQRIPRVQINAPNLAATDSLTLDGAALSRAVVGARLPVDPGAHVLVVTRRGRELARNGFSINERQNQNINLDFPVAPPEPPPNTGNGNAGNGNAGNGNAGNGNAGNGNAGNGNAGSGNAGNGDPRGRSWVGMGNGNAGVTPVRTGLSAGASAAIAVVVILVVGGAVGGTLGALYGGPVTPPYVGNVGMGTLRVQ